ncbi:AraC family transcriptional regulator [Breznakia sp. PF5-3]|uniref:AraC family transcriptional regulator n=1 Tax=unclassified Breznakia TaxID=2623764 RepID=UPI0024069793|nr:MULTISPECIES: helix-turn-helix domain-containing protein [unclassified Breznakia]MDF9823840.1 AraC family transcriptional regulator [Breznakia sp. PM6-1]MDF9834594.1 AraC family transcriptional regulator [Breznakia sp. PF5-3]MDF9836789.1 AraC family transcriptional regulator [Breznakia sp. PFB2-8]MDF9858762.1 AraC family transcriptional regulator [Breznakia sp. PH5-24]
MHAWESIQITINYIEDHLCDEIKIDKLASLACLSTFYYQRLFKRLVKCSLQEYMKYRRLAVSSKALCESDARIIDIAVKYQFSNHANYSRAFKEVYGVTPDEYRKHQLPLNHFVKPELLLNYVMMDEGIPLISDEMVIEITRKKFDKERYFVGIEQEVEVSELMSPQTTGVSTITYLWEELGKRVNDIPYKRKDGNDFGVLYMGNAREGNCMYMAGVEVDRYVEVKGFKTFVLPIKEYLVTGFEAETFDELVNSAINKADAFTARWMEEHNLVGVGGFAAELYYPPTEQSAYLEHLVCFKEKE